MPKKGRSIRMADTQDKTLPTGPITKDSIVGAVLDRYPQTMGVFLQFGYTPLQDPTARQALAGRTTIEQATKIVVADLDALLAALNRIKAAVDASATASTTVSLPITKNHLVGEVTEAFPSTLEVFLQHGFDHLADANMRRTVAKTVTIEMASTIHGIELNGFLAKLNQAAGTG